MLPRSPDWPAFTKSWDRKRWEKVLTVLTHQEQEFAHGLIPAMEKRDPVAIRILQEMVTFAIWRSVPCEEKERRNA